MNAELKSASAITASRYDATSAFAQRPSGKRRFPSPAFSLRLPVTPENRVRLRALRQAELRAWNLAFEPDTNAALRAEVNRALCEGQRESQLFAGVMVVTVAALVIGALASLHFVQHHPDFVALVRRLLGAG